MSGQGLETWSCQDATRVCFILTSWTAFNLPSCLDTYYSPFPPRKSEDAGKGQEDELLSYTHPRRSTRSETPSFGGSMIGRNGGIEEGASMLPMEGRKEEADTTMLLLKNWFPSCHSCHDEVHVVHSTELGSDCQDHNVQLHSDFVAACHSGHGSAASGRRVSTSTMMSATR